MSVWSDRRPLSQIGGLGAYLRQVGWSLWWRYELERSPRHAATPPRPARTSRRRPPERPREPRR